jgi:hypothetical protein
MYLFITVIYLARIESGSKLLYGINASRAGSRENKLVDD